MLDASTASSWSSKIDFESCSRRPMSVDFPSSTEPAVANRSSSMTGLEVALALAVLHGGFRELVVGPGGAPLGDPGDGHLGQDLDHVGGRRPHRAGTRHVA